MKERRYRPGIVGPLILITIGVLLLLNQLGMLSWTMLWSLWRFWPVILILLGVEVLIGMTRSKILYLGGVLLAIAVLGGLVGYAMLRGEQALAPRPATATQSVSHAMQDSDRGQVKLSFGAGTLGVSALTDSPSFVEGRIEYSRDSRQATQDFRVRNGQAEFSLESHSQQFWLPNDQAGERWTLDFTPRIPLEMDISFAAGSAQVNLRELRATKLDLAGAVGQVMATLPAAAGTTTASVRLAIGQVMVQIPAGVGARIRVSRGLGALEVDSRRFTRSGDYWISEDYQTAQNKVHLDVACALGTINVR